MNASAVAARSQVEPATRPPGPRDRTRPQPAESVPADVITDSCERVLDLAAAFFNVSGRELRRPGRSADDVSRVRQVAMYVTHVVLGLSMRDIGRAFGRDRTTVMYACHAIEDLRDDAEFDAIVSRMERVVAVAFRGHRLYWTGAAGQGE